MSDQAKQNDEAVEQPQGAAPVEEGGGPGEQEAAAGAPEDEAGMAADLAKAREKVRDLEDRMLRMAAEQENFKKRMQRERETAMKYAEEGILKELLPSLDNLERAIEQAQGGGDVASLLQGVEMTYKGLANTLEKFGLTPLDGKGQPFDPNFHEALAMEESDEFPENTILQEYQRGYMFKDRLIRAAKVVVSKGKTE